MRIAIDKKQLVRAAVKFSTRRVKCGFQTSGPKSKIRLRPGRSDRYDL